MPIEEAQIELIKTNSYRQQVLGWMPKLQKAAWVAVASLLVLTVSGFTVFVYQNINPPQSAKAVTALNAKIEKVENSIAIFNRKAANDTVQKVLVEYRLHNIEILIGKIADKLNVTN